MLNKPAQQSCYRIIMRSNESNSGAHLRRRFVFHEIVPGKMGSSKKTSVRREVDHARVESVGPKDFTTSRYAWFGKGPAVSGGTYFIELSPVPHSVR